MADRISIVESEFAFVPSADPCGKRRDEGQPDETCDLDHNHVGMCLHYEDGNMATAFFPTHAPRLRLVT